MVAGMVFFLCVEFSRTRNNLLKLSSGYDQKWNSGFGGVDVYCGYL